MIFLTPSPLEKLGRLTSERQSEDEAANDDDATSAAAAKPAVVVDAAAEAAEADEKTARELAQAAATQPHWPWESVRNKIRSSLQEVNVLLDVVNIAKDRRCVCVCVCVCDCV